MASVTDNWNLTTRGFDIISPIATGFFTSTLDIMIGTDEQKETKAPKGPKGSKESGQPSEHFENLEWKQSLAVIGFILITILIIIALLQIKIHKDCFANFRTGQLRNKTGRILFILFFIALILFYINCVVFMSSIFRLDSLSENSYAFHRIFSVLPYRIARFCMALFFIFRLHFVFKDSAFRLNKYVLIILIILLAISTILGCVAGITGPLKLIQVDKDEGNHINPNLLMQSIATAILIFVDIVTMWYYFKRLMTIVIIQSEVSISKENVSGQNQTEMAHLNMNEQTPITTDDDDDDDKFVIKVDERIVTTITKSTLLSLIGILSSMWLHLEMIIEISQGSTDPVNHSAVMCIDGGINLICMYLVFTFSKPYYEIGCKYCHIGMSKCCLFLTKKAVLKAKEADI